MRAPFALAFASIVVAGPAVALGLNINPVLVTLSPEVPSTMLALRNDGKVPARLQLRVFSWDESPDGKPALAPTDEVAFHPPLLTLAPAEQRNIRIGAATPFGELEKTYRIVIEELPPLQAAGAGQGVAMLTNFSIPIFLEAKKGVDDARIDGLEVSGGKLAVRVRNAGTVHFRVQKVIVRGEPAFELQQDGWYVLAHHARAFTFEIPKDKCKRLASLRVEVTTDKGALTETLQLDPGACARSR